MSVRLEDLAPCFQGVIPAIIATCSADGEPNVTYLSQVYFMDARHVALSCQFFNKTRRNVEENPYATVLVHHPVSFELWRFRLRYQRSEDSGELYDQMAMRIQVIASHTGMAGVFRLLSADIYEVLSVDPVVGFLEPPDPLLEADRPLVAGPLTELRGVQLVSSRISQATDLESLLFGALEAFDEILGFSHSMVLVPEETGRRLVTIATRGYDGTAGHAGPRASASTTGADAANAFALEGIGAEVCIGEGTIGTAAEHRRMIKVTGVGSELRYGRAIRDRIEEVGNAEELTPEIPLPGLPDAQAQLALPLLVGDRLIGALAVESRDPLGFDEWDEAFLQILANQVALGIDRMQESDDDEEIPRRRETRGLSTGEATAPRPAPGTAVAIGALAPAKTETMHSPSATVAPTPASTGTESSTTSMRGSGDPTPPVFVYYANDDCIFVDGEYLIRNVPGKILWKLLSAYRAEGRTEFTNRELRLDRSLGLPPIKDNLESRLILLRKRLASRCPRVRIIPVRRGRFRLEVDGAFVMEERTSI